jgi:hypothetical protein
MQLQDFEGGSEGEGLSGCKAMQPRSAPPGCRHRALSKDHHTIASKALFSITRSCTLKVCVPYVDSC